MILRGLLAPHVQVRRAASREPQAASASEAPHLEDLQRSSPKPEPGERKPSAAADPVDIDCRPDPTLFLLSTPQPVRQETMGCRVLKGTIIQCIPGGYFFCTAHYHLQVPHSSAERDYSTVCANKF
jgi:hypothetical protein